MKVLKLMELCSGIGAQYVGLTDSNLFDVESVGTADLDKEVVVSYAAMHCGLTKELIEEYPDYPSKEEMAEQLTKKRLGYDFKNDKSYDWVRLSKKKDKTKGIEKYWLADKLSKNYGDMTQIKHLPECDFLTYSTPCTDLSIAGKQEGLAWTCADCGEEYNPGDLDVHSRYTCPKCGSHNIKSTRSGLLYEVERLLVDAKDNGKLPSYLLMENVDALVSKKYISSFNDWLDRLTDLGYNNYYSCINAKNAGVPQNRNRIFCVSIRGDIDKEEFEFPVPFDSGLRLKDILEDDFEIVDKYFLSDEVQARLQITDPNFKNSIVGTTKPDFRTIGQRDVVYQKDGIMGALVATDYKQPKQILEGVVLRGGMQAHQTTKTDGISTCLTAAMGEGGGYVPIIGYNKPIQSGTMMGKYENYMDNIRRVYDEAGVSPTITTCAGGHREPKVSRNNLKVVRKLTPKECHRLMGFSDDMYDRCKALDMSDTQGYHQAGNSIVTTVISLIAEHLYKAQYDGSYVCYDENFIQPQAV